MDRPLGFIKDMDLLLLSKNKYSEGEIPFYKLTNRPDILFSISGAMKLGYTPIYEPEELEFELQLLKIRNLSKDQKNNLIKLYSRLLNSYENKSGTQTLGLKLINHKGIINKVLIDQIYKINSDMISSLFLNYFINQINEIDPTQLNDTKLPISENLKQKVFHLINSNVYPSKELMTEFGIDDFDLGRETINSVISQLLDLTIGYFNGDYKTDAAVAYLFTEAGDLVTISRINNHNDIGIIGGMVDQGESSEIAIKREIYEEVGVHVNEVKFVGRQDKQTYNIDVYTTTNTDWSRVRLGDSGEGLVSINPLEVLFKPSSYRDFNINYLNELIANWKTIFKGEHILDFHFVESIEDNKKFLRIYMTCLREPKEGEYVLDDSVNGVKIYIPESNEPKRCIIKCCDFHSRDKYPHCEYLMYQREEILNKLKYFSISKLIKDE